MEHKFLFILAAVFLIAGCVNFGSQTEGVSSGGPDFSVVADPNWLFPGEKTTVYIDVENNGNRPYEKIFLDVFDTGIMEPVAAPFVLEKCSDACENQGYSRQGARCRLLGSPGSYIQTGHEGAKQECQQKAQENGYEGTWECFCEPGSTTPTGNLITGQLVNFGFDIEDDCYITGYYDSGDNYQYTITCNFMFDSDDYIIPVSAVYHNENRGSGTQESYDVVAYPNLQWDDISIRANLRYDSYADKLFMGGDASWVRDGEYVLVTFPNGRQEYYQAEIEKRNNNPTGKVVLDKDGEEIYFIPTREIEDGEIKGTTIREPNYSVLTNSLNENTKKAFFKRDTDLITGQATGTDSTATLEMTNQPAEDAEGSCSAAGGTCKGPAGTCEAGESYYEEGNSQCQEDYGLTYVCCISTEATETPSETDACTDYLDCQADYSCGVCVEGVCVESSQEQKIGDGCQQTCQCQGHEQGNIYCTDEGVCARADNWKICSREKSGIIYYYCSPDCNSDSIVKEGLEESNCKKQLASTDGVKSKICDNSVIDCSGLEAKGYNCPICWQGICVDSEQKQEAGDGCDRDCQCISQRCVDGNCEEKSQPARDQCKDGTALGQCVQDSPPKYCDEAGYLWQMCAGPDDVIGTDDDCGCPEGQECLTDGSCGLPNRCSSVIWNFLENDKQSLECVLEAPSGSELLKQKTENKIHVRMRYNNKLSFIQKIPVISKEWYRRDWLSQQLDKKPSTYIYRNRDLEMTVEFTEEMPIVIRDRPVYVHFTLKNVGPGNVYPIKLYEELTIDQSETIIDESCISSKVLVPEQGVFPRVTCQLKLPENINYLKTFVVNINVNYAYELRDSIIVQIEK